MIFVFFMNKNTICESWKSGCSPKINGTFPYLTRWVNKSVIEIFRKWISENPEQKLGEIKILVAEDEPLCRELLEEFLWILGAKNITFVSNGQELKDIISLGNHFDLILSDNQMEEKHWSAALRELTTEQPWWQRNTILILQTSDYERVKEEWGVPWLHACLQKGYHLEDLAQVLNRYFYVDQEY